MWVFVVEIVARLTYELNSMISVFGDTNTIHCRLPYHPIWCCAYDWNATSCVFIGSNISHFPFPCHPIWCFNFDVVVIERILFSWFYPDHPCVISFLDPCWSVLLKLEDNAVCVEKVCHQRPYKWCQGIPLLRSVWHRVPPCDVGMCLVIQFC